MEQFLHKFFFFFFTLLEKNCEVIQLFVMEEVPGKVRVSWEMLPASTGRFYNSCTGACSKYFQRAQKAKGRYNVRETPGIGDIVGFIPWFWVFSQKKQQSQELFFIPPEGIAFYCRHDGNNQHQHIPGCPWGLCFAQALSSAQDSYAVFYFIPLPPCLAL